MTGTAARVAAVVATVALSFAGCGLGEQPSAEPRKASRAGPPSASPVASADLQRCPEVRQRPAGGADALPAVTLPCLGAGPDVPLSGLRGPLVLNLWASWCEPCRDEAPLFQRLHGTAGERVQVIGVDTKDRSEEAALAFAAHRQLRYPSLYDRRGRTLAAAKAGTGLPVTLFVDRAGKVTHRKVGPYRTYGELTADVREHLGVRA